MGEYSPVRTEGVFTETWKRFVLIGIVFGILIAFFATGFFLFVFSPNGDLPKLRLRRARPVSSDETLCDEVTPVGQLLQTRPITSERLEQLIGDDDQRGKRELLRFLGAHGLLANKPACKKPDCATGYRLHQFTNTNDGYMWRCPRCTQTARLSVRDGSFFQRSRLAIPEILRIAHHWALHPQTRLLSVHKDKGSLQIRLR
ncbi:hypothetical protein QR680_010891 [Steinernema hermaphroditum]|uniref:Uncharacterized protein n=1 Tax=Steinernema hermaphroditum TaxID=289476 RepID=A0AA39IQG3_9BILA|nr:hypothetical protein QR680_010891 [Steinernema hermaphroditum]